MDKGQHDHAGVVRCRLLEAGQDSARLLEPADEPLDDVSAPVGLSVELDGSRCAVLVRLAGNHRLDILLQQKTIDPVGAIALVAGNLHRPQHVFIKVRDVSVVDQLHHGLRLVGLARRQRKVQGIAAAVAEHMDFRREAPARTA